MQAMPGVHDPERSGESKVLYCKDVSRLRLLRQLSVARRRRGAVFAGVWC